MNKITNTLATLLLTTTVVQADQVILDDLIVDGSVCVGQDCINGESFGFDTLRLKENNLRIKAVDTSTTSSFPSRDWQITFNDSSNGGQNKFSIDDIDGGRTPFTIEAGAPSHSLYVDDSGRVGIGTSTPVTNIHTKTGNTPTLRLEQDGSSGFSAQTWDIASNETNFFIRDATNGSTLPFRIRPGAPSSAIDIAASGNIGMGTSSPVTHLHISDNGYVSSRLENRALGINWDQTNSGSGTYRLNASNHTGTELELDTDGNLTVIGSITSDARNSSESLNGHFINDGYVTLRLDNRALGINWDQTNSGSGTYRLNASNHTGTEFELDTDGNLNISGHITVASTGSNIPDYVFKNDYQLMSLTDLQKFILKNEHLPGIPSADKVSQTGELNMTEMQLKLLEKVEELTLYILKQKNTIAQLNERVKAVEKIN